MTNIRKIKILFCGEASWLSTGFATFNREIIKRLYKDERYEIAEMGSYGHQYSQNAQSLPWKFYGVVPVNEQEKQIYKQNKLNEFGAYKIEAVLSDFQPDIVVDFRDPWMFGHLVNNRFRSNYKLILCPTVDSEPQRKDWIEQLFKKADVLCTYSEFGKRVLESEKLKITDIVSPGVNLDIFNVKDKEEIRKKWCLNKDLFIFGTVMRNQKRKLFPDLFESYSIFRKKYRNNERVQKSILLCHTSYPDLGWDIPELIYRNQIQRHVVFTYICDSCSETFISWFIPCNKKGIAKCVVCGENAAHMTNTNKGYSVEDLSEVYSLMDVYVQPAICEGWGVPIVEAKACGVPTMCSNYSAMEDHCKNKGTIPIKIDRMYTEAETMSKRSLPDVADMADKFYMFITDDKKRKRISKNARKCAEEKHNWNVSSEKIRKIFDSLELPDRSKTWDSPPNLLPLTSARPSPKLNDGQFVLWCYINILGRRPDPKGFNDWISNLQNGAERNSVESYFRNEIATNNKFEEIRWHKSLELRDIKVNTEDKTNDDILSGIVL